MRSGESRDELSDKGWGARSLVMRPIIEGRPRDAR